jgi:hypothetical protein
MKTLIIGSILAGAAITSEFDQPAFGASSSRFVRPAAIELSHLRGQDGGRLTTLRAGKLETRTQVSGAERAQLLQAQQRSPELATLRGGEVSSVLLTILVIVAIVAIVLVIL